MASMTEDDIIVVGTMGNPGQEESAHMDPLKMGGLVDVGSMIKEEIEEINPVQRGYQEDSVKYEKQVRRYNGKSSK
jgi:hypothetical protein